MMRLILNNGGRTLGLGLFAAALLGAGCTQQTPPPAPPSDAKTMTLRRIVGGLTSPLELAAPNDNTGRLFIVDQVGVIWLVSNTGAVASKPFLDLRSQLDTLTAAYDERGLLGLALHPNFLTNNLFYVLFTTRPSAAAPSGTATEVHLSEFRVSAVNPDLADPLSERVLLRIAKPQTNHNGGQLAFGPDGYLYIGLGDGGGSGDSGFGHTLLTGNAQDTTNLLGKILRIDVNSGDPYGIPPDNPFVGVLLATPEIYAYGLRNPWRFSFDVAPGGATRLFCGDVGQELVEEVDLIERAGNYGWNRKEGSQCFSPLTPTSPPASCANHAVDGTPFRDPIMEYNHADSTGAAFGSAVIGGYVYRGAAVPNLAGAYVFGDYSMGAGGKIFVGQLGTDGTWTFAEVKVAGTASGRLDQNVLAFGRDTAGELYVLASSLGGPTGSSGVLYKIVGYE